MSALGYILSTGARTPLGQGAIASAAAVRAGMSGIYDRVLLSDRPWTFRQAAFDPKLSMALTGPDRLVALAESACREACESLPSGSAPSPFPLFLGLPEFRPGFGRRDAAALSERFAELRFSVPISEIITFPLGHASGFVALAAAADALRRGVCEICLVGGVDSYYQPETLQWLDRNRQLAGGDARSAFVPGEGASFCVMASKRAITVRESKPLLRLTAAASDREEHVIKTDAVCLGEGLCAAILAATREVSDDQVIDDVICDMNGERYRGEEWGFVCLRLPQLFSDPTGYLAPADCWGDVGAASGPLFVMLAHEAARRGYNKGQRTMLWASSEAGVRGVALVEKVDSA